jgi:hypothetical protein
MSRLPFDRDPKETDRVSLQGILVLIVIVILILILIGYVR